MFLGKKILAIEGLEKNSKEVIFIFEDGKLRFYHQQDCCETVYLEDFNGDPEDLIGKNLVSLDTSSSNKSTYTGDETWTFYSIRTTGGDLWMRWLGESNGYYSTEVSIEWRDLLNTEKEFSLYDMMDATGIWVNRYLPITLNLSISRDRTPYWWVSYNNSRQLFFVEPGDEVDAADFGVLGITSVENRNDVINHVINYITGPDYVSPNEPGYFKGRY